MAITPTQYIWQYGQHPTDPDSIPQVSILADGTEVCPAPHALQVEHKESEPARWTLGIQDQDGYYHPKNAASPWFRKMTRNKKSMVASVTWEDAAYSLVGVSTHYGHSRNFTAPGSIDFTWSGIDATSKLFATGVTMATLRTRGATVCTTVSAVEEILTAAGITYDLSGMESTPIRMQHRQDGRMGDWLQSLLDVLWHKWVMIGGVFTVYKPDYAATPTWTYGADDGAFILEDSLSSDAPTFVNQVIARRAKEASGGTSAPIEHTTFGAFTQTFTPPLEGIFWRKLAQQGGRYTDFYLYSGASLIAVREASAYSGSLTTAVNSGSISSVTATWGNLPGSTATEGYGKIQFLGGEEDDLAGVFAQDQDYSLTRQNLTSLELGDDLCSQELPPSTLIGDGPLLLRHADGFLVEQAANQEPASYRIPLNLDMRPGQIMAVVDPILGTENRYIRGVSHTISNDPSQRMTRAHTVAIPAITIDYPA